MEKSIQEIKKYLDYIDQCVASNSFEDIPENLDCIREELAKLEEKKGEK
jgi:hypothetical protein